jgi:fructokinase
MARGASKTENGMGTGGFAPVITQLAEAHGDAHGPLLGGIEGGGTKMVCALGYADGTLLDRRSFPTCDPDETVAQLAAYFGTAPAEVTGAPLVALGVGTFGPIEVNPASPGYGCLLQTPKSAWSGFDWRAALRRQLAVPLAFDTDVNAACLGELTYGSARGLDSVVYITVGTGIGVGVCVDGRPLHGMLHPEAGHIMLSRSADDDFAGVCPAHGSCLEGLASGPAICARFGVAQASDVADDARFLQLESDYLAQALTTFTLTYAPRRIIVGGGVPDHVPALLPLVRRKMAWLLNGYLQTPEVADMDRYIAAPSCKGNQGVLGALVLAARLLA